jgi:hypothetical protein
MAYYPSSQITLNLYTNGGEYSLSTTNKNYKGFYHKINNGKIFTGKSPTDLPNILLIKPISNQIEGNEQNDSTSSVITYNYSNIDDKDISKQYSKLYKSLPERNIPTSSPPYLTPTDIQQGVITRYFSKKNNELKYMEINKDTFQAIMSKNPQIAWDLYSAASLTWYIKGDREKVYTVNESLVSHLETTNKWWGFSQYFKSDFSKYFIEN